MIFRNRNQCHLRMVLSKLAMYNIWRFPRISPICNFQVNYASFSSFPDSIWPFITKPSPYSFHLQLSCAFWFIGQGQRVLKVNRVFLVWWTTVFQSLLFKEQSWDIINVSLRNDVILYLFPTRYKFGRSKGTRYNFVCSIRFQFKVK